MTIHAHTEPGGRLPAYINLSEVTSAELRGPAVRVTVRSRGDNFGSHLDLTYEELQALAVDVNAHLARQAIAGNLTANAGGVPYE